MAFFSQTVAKHLSGYVVRRERLVAFEFKSETIRMWEGGFGRLRSADGQIWHGDGGLGAIGDIEAPIGGSAPNVEFTLSGVDPAIIAKVRSSSEEIKSRPVTVYVQHFDENWQPLDGLYATFSGIMDRTTVSRPVGQDTRTVKLIAETEWTRRGFSLFAYLSDRSQKRLHAGDRGAEQVASMATKTLKWPQY